jgi:NAD(P)-dependent dehydrogenase (short-subunit alcohol dehydrogenase family)
VVSHEQNGKVVIVTGAAGGFGRALVKAFVQSGFRVGASDIDATAVHQMQADYGKDCVLGIAGDIAQPGACSAQVGDVVEHFGGLHALVNNAAVGMSLVRPDHFTRTVQIEDIDEAIWERFISVNLNGAFFLAKAAVPIFRRQRWGRIVNVTTSFFTMLRPGFSPYGPAKAGLEAWSASLAGELDGTGITVNVVVPGGPADTPMVPPESGFERRKLVAPECMSPPILWLCSEEAGNVTGARYVAAEWQASRLLDAAGCGRAGWPDLANNPVWPD